MANASFHLTSGTNVIQSGGGAVLHSVTVNTTFAGTVTLYDNTAASSTVIAVITVTAAMAPMTLTYDRTLVTGLTAVLSGTGDVTVTVAPSPGESIV